MKFRLEKQPRYDNKIAYNVFGTEEGEAERELGRIVCLDVWGYHWSAYIMVSKNRYRSLGEIKSHDAMKQAMNATARHIMLPIQDNNTGTMYGRVKRRVKAT